MSRTQPLPESARIAAEARGRVKKARQGRGRPPAGAAGRAPTVVAGYYRISEDTKKKGLGVKRQRADVEALAVRLFGPEVEVRAHTDNDLSGASFTDRAAYGDLLLAVESGEITTVLAYDVDRLTREGLEAEELWLIAEVYGVRIVTCAGDDIAPAVEGSEGAVAMARVRSAFAAMEVAKTRRRIRRKSLELATSGKANGGSHRPFGYSHDRLSVVEDEAELIRDAAARVLRGEAMRSVCRDWNGQGITTPDRKRVGTGDGGERVEWYEPGGVWTTQTLRRMLMSGRIAGWRDHHGEMIARGEWPEIVERETVERLRALLTNPARRTGPARARRYLLTGGLLRCGLCGCPLASKGSHQNKGAGSPIVPTYACVKDRGGCDRIYIKAEGVDEFVTATFFESLDDIAAGESREQARNRASVLAGVLAEVEEHESKLDELADLLGEGLMTRARYAAQQAKVQARLDEARRRQAEIPDSSAVADLVSTRDELRAEWGDKPVDAQRAAIATLIDYVPILPGTVGRRGFDVSRIGDAVWKV